MSVINPNESSRSWHQHSRAPSVQLYLADGDGSAGALVGQRAAGFPLTVQPCEPDSKIDPAGLAGLAAAVVEVAADTPRSIKRFETLAKKSRTPLIAAVYEPPLALVRALIRAGAHDVLPLPLDMAEIEAALAPLRDRLGEGGTAAARRGKLVTVIKSAGGAGATALLSQLAVRYAERETAANRQTCLIDLDVQFGDAAFQLGLRPKLSLQDLVEAGNRLDGDLLQATTTEHQSSLKVIAAPPEMMPLESMSSEQVLEIVDLATGEFDTVFVDLPSNWANWSLSLLARSDLVLLVTPISIPALRQARRQLDLLRSQDLADLDIRVVANRCETGLFKRIRTADVRSALGCDIAFSIVEDDEVMQGAIDQGVPISEIKRKTALARDIDGLDRGLAEALGREH